jgi:hypothetical protein
MKKLYFLDEEEKQRILNIHESATKRQYLSEQIPFGPQIPPNPYQIALDKMKSDDKVAADKAAADKAAADKKTTEDKAKKVQQYRQQIITKTSDTTKQIQALLGLEQTGNMDSGLLQKINDKLNGKSQEAPKSVVAPPPAAGTSGISGTVAGVSGISGPVASSTTGTPTAAVGPQFNSKSFPEIKGYTPTTPTLR